MDVASACPLPVSSLLWQRGPTWTLTIVCRATFLLRPGEPALAMEQEPPAEADAHWDDDPSRSLFVASDLAPQKPRPEVILVGSAFAPGGRPARSVAARLAVGEVDKTVEAWVERSFDPSGALREGPPMARFPLVYERAAGGPGTWNVVGVARGARNRQGHVMLPSLQPAGVTLATPGDFCAPIGFGPIAPSWPSRREKLGRHASEVTTWRGPLLPPEVEPSYFSVAPLDQQLSQIRPGDRLVLENLHPDHPKLVTSVPQLQPQATLGGRGGSYPIQLVCDTMWIDTDRSILTLTWRGGLALGHRQEAGLLTVSLPPSARPPQPAWAPKPQAAPPPEASPESTTATATDPNAITSSGKRGAATMPFMAVHGGSALPFTPATPFPPPSQPRDPLAQSSSSWMVGAPPRSVPPPDLQALEESPPTMPPAVVQAIVPPPAPPSAPMMAPPIATPPPIVASKAPALEVSREPSKPAASPWVIGGAAQGLSVGAAAVGAVIEATPSQNDGGVLGSSNAAADAAVAPWTRPRAEARAAVVPEPSEPSVRPITPLGEGAALTLVWFDPAVMPRVRRRPELRQILKDAEDDEPDPELDDPTPGEDPLIAEERRAMLDVLARAPSADEASLREALEKGVRQHGKFVAQLMVIDGEMTLPFDEVEALRATVTAALPLAGGDDRLKAALADAEAFLSKAGEPVAPSVPEALGARIREAFAQTKRAITPADLEAQIERGLLGKRRYQKREVFGGGQLRALIAPNGLLDPPREAEGAAGAPKPMPVYLPEALAKELPLAVRFRARMVAELGFAVDQYEAHEGALRARSLGWVITPKRKA